MTMSEATRQQIDEVITKVNSLLAPDGAQVDVVAIEEETLVVEFRAGGDAACERCVIGTDAVEMLVRQAVASHLPAISEVEIRNK